jgi:transposase-like protein
LDEAFAKVNDQLCYLWRAVDHQGEVLEAVVTSKRNKAAALKLLKRIMKQYGTPHGHRHPTAWRSTHRLKSRQRQTETFAERAELS